MAPLVIAVVSTLFSTVAQGAGGFLDILAPLVQVGAVGAILAWYLVKQEPRLRAIEFELQQVQRALMLNTLLNPVSSDQIKRAAGDIIKEIDDRQNENTHR